MTTTKGGGFKVYNKIQNFTEMYNEIIHKVLTKTIGRYPLFFSKNFKVLYSKYIYHIFTQKFLNLKDPRTISEKIMWLKLYYKNPLISVCADKYLVRGYVENNGLSNILNVLFGVYNSEEEINFNELPNQFVLKATHGCGYNIICRDKSKLDIAETKQKLKTWMNSIYGLKSGEWHYSEIRPRVICEKYLNELDTSKSIVDYKIHCFNGQPYYFEIIYERSGNKIKESFYNLQWEKLNLTKKEGDDVAQPKNLAAMIQSALVLAKPFPFVRVDFYEIKGQLYFGELTFTPLGGMQDVDLKDETLEIMGNLLILPRKNKTQIPFIS
jgi:hypothetical protein